MRLNQKNITGFITYLGFYLVLILIHGYVFGSNDQMDFMPYARHIQNPELYALDFYINCIGSRFNERWLLAHFVSLFPHTSWPVLFLLLHALFTIILVRGLKKWVSVFIKNELVQWACLMFCLIILYHRNLGGNELYYNMLCASLMAKAIAVWALYYAFQHNHLKAIFLTILSTYIHPIVGVQILILCIVFLQQGFKIKYIVFSILGISPYAYALLNELKDSIPASEFVQIMHLRNAHHFFPSTFGLLNFVLLVPLFVTGVFIFYKLERRIFYFMTTILAGCVLYGIGMLILPELMIVTQWFKTTIWLKFFSILGLIHWAVQHRDRILLKIHWLSPKMILLSLIFLFVLFKVRRNMSESESWYQLPWNQESDEIKTAIQARDQSQRDAVFLVGADYTAFKYYGERSTYVDWKAIPHNGPCLKSWEDRIFKAYGLKDTANTNLSDIYTASNLYLSTLNSIQKTQLKSAGVDYIIFRKQTDKEFVIEAL